MNTPMTVNPPATSVTAIASLVCGITSWTVAPLLGAIAAVICGHLARAEIRRSAPGTLGGDGLAIAGLVLGWLNIVMCLLIVTAFLMLFGGIAWLGSHN
jgi:hypothetical protein